MENSEPSQGKPSLIDLLLDNQIPLSDLEDLRKDITPEDLAIIIQRIYDLNQNSILHISALQKVMRSFDDWKNQRRNAAFIKKIKKGFRSSTHPQNKIILAEGDSWFNYPIILTDIIDSIAMHPQLGVYSIAKGGDWLLNMLHARKYVEELSVLHPDVFLISGGGNDLVGSYRLAAVIKPTHHLGDYQNNKLSVQLISDAVKRGHLSFNEDAFYAGVGHLSKDFFALLMFFYLQYSYLIDGILNGGKTHQTKFPGIRIITQGYDFPIPNDEYHFGWNPALWYVPFIRMFLGHGSWLKTPLMIRGITSETTQRNILYAMIYLFNEMVIQTGYRFNETETAKRVFHIDSRYSIGENGWTDELHAKPPHFIKIGQVFAGCIQGTLPPTYDHVYQVKDF